MIPVRNGPPQRPSGRASAGVISNGIKKIFRLLPLTLHRLSYAAFAPLAEYKGTRLAGIYSGDLYTFLNLVFVIALSVGAVMAVLQLAVAGYMYMGSDLWQNKQKVKDKIRDAFIGLFLLLSVWIVLNLINPNILKLNLIFPEIPSRPTTVQSAPTPPTAYGVSPIEQRAADAIFKDEQAARDLLRAGGININKKPCTAVRERNCTNVGGLGGNAIGGLKSLKANCRCDVLVTGGTEFWNHTVNTTHQPGNSVVDIAPNPTLNQYLLGAGVTPTNGTKITKGSAVYTYETLGANGVSTGNHWHVRF